MFGCGCVFGCVALVRCWLCVVVVVVCYVYLLLWFWLCGAAFALFGCVNLVWRWLSLVVLHSAFACFVVIVCLFWVCVVQRCWLWLWVLFIWCCLVAFVGFIGWFDLTWFVVCVVDPP